MNNKEYITYCTEQDKQFQEKRIQIERPGGWEELDWNVIKRVCGEIGSYEYKMCMNLCKTTEIAIAAIKNKRRIEQRSEDILDSLEEAEYYERACLRYLPNHYNDLEEDNYQRQEIRLKNG